MSLDVYLTGEKETTTCTCSECGNKHGSEIRTIFYSSNITHNLGEMADKAGIYKALWRPEELKIAKAKQLIEPLEKGLTDLKARPEYFANFDAPNGWGLYEHFVPFVQEYLDACKVHPEAYVGVSR